MRRSYQWRLARLLLIFPAALALIAAAAVPDKKARTEEGEFRISFVGREIGSERFAVVTSADTVQSTSVVSFRNPQNPQQKITLETRLAMNARFVPTSYELKSDAGGKTGTVVGRFSPNQVIFEYSGTGDSVRRGLLVGDEYTILDTNVFHHFMFLVRLFEGRRNERGGRFEVVIPQENDSGFLRMKELDKETIVAGGKKIRCRRFQIDSGAVSIDLWADDQHRLQKIAVPDRKIEVVRVN
jgi:hypothetical protein